MSDPSDDIVDEILESLQASEDAFNATVQIGDVVFANGDKAFTFSEFRYCTARKGYKVVGHSVNSDAVVCESDIVGERLYLSATSCYKIERDGEVVWRYNSRVYFRYIKDRPEELPEKDAYGFLPDFDTVFEGYYIDNHDVTTEFPDSHVVTLVELITPFRNGQPGQLICVNGNELEFIEKPDDSSSDISH